MKKNISKFVSIILASSLFYTSAFAMNDTLVAKPSKNTIILEEDGGQREISNISIFSIKDKNYFMLKDIGFLLNLGVNWNSNNKKIEVLLSEPYSQLSPNLNKHIEGRQIIPATQTISVDGKDNTLNGYNIDGYLYFPISDIAQALNFSCKWDKNTKTVVISKEKKLPDDTELKVPENIDDLVNLYLDERIEHKTIETNDVTYITGSKNYDSIEKYIKENIDKKFNMKDFVVKESSPINNVSIYSDNEESQEYINQFVSPINILDVRFYVDGYPTFYGYRIYVFSGYAKIINYMGKWNNDFDKSKIQAFKYTDEELKQMAIDKDGFQNKYPIKDVRIQRFFDMETLEFKADVEIVYLQDNRYAIVKSNRF
ncbi:stalk domain-containing protein [Anaerotignum propionicum]|uniref:stalk domain-containing protein n=1 Tax=Anaerotignum propionicum TaxID=28446 RepID=UPI00210A96E9|nr:stalk domain-containing protein [Anaerotignum propionicum]MCQ4935543.1 copper amine oxidase N-terminal domain-containing protein [Anaerotignum propionicum]